MSLFQIEKKLSFAVRYVNFLLKAKHRNGHGIHSPFIYEFVTTVIFDRREFKEYAVFDKIRNELKNSKILLEMDEMGAGSYVFKNSARRISDIARNASVTPKYGKLLFRMVRFFQPENIIELGTSVGLSAAYLSMGRTSSDVITIEGNKNLYDFALKFLKKHKIANVSFVHGSFDEIIFNLQNNYQFVFIDGNHTYDATLRYFNHFIDKIEEGILIFDDINWSPEMQRVWKEIKHISSEYVTIELFFMGMVLKRPSITPGNYRLRF